MVANYPMVAPTQGSKAAYLVRHGLTKPVEIRNIAAMTDTLNRFFAAMSDPTRRAVIERLVSGPATVGELHAPHDMALPTFMRHLGVLEKTGIVRSIKKGRVRTCYMEPRPLVEAQGWLAWQRHLWETRLDENTPSFPDM